MGGVRTRHSPFLSRPCGNPASVVAGSNYGQPAFDSRKAQTPGTAGELGLEPAKRLQCFGLGIIVVNLT